MFTIDPKFTLFRGHPRDPIFTRSGFMDWNALDKSTNVPQHLPATSMNHRDQLEVSVSVRVSIFNI